MEVVIPYQKCYAIPPICCVCGETNPNSQFQIRSKEIRQFMTTASVTLTFMKCPSCVDEYASIKKTEKPGMLIGGGIGLFLGIAVGAALFIASGGSDGTPGDMINDLLGPVLAVGAIFGLFGLLIGKAIWSTRLSSNMRQRMKQLESPVTILDFGYETGFLGNIKKANLKLNFSNDAYGLTFMTLNGLPLE